MIADKVYSKVFKSFIITVVICCAVLCLVSCSIIEGENDVNDVNDVFSQLSVKESETDVPAFAEHIYIIISNTCSGDLSLKARELSDAIQGKTGILTSLKYDNELTVIPQNSCQIVLGNTNRLVSNNALDVLRDREYLCRWDDETLVICGRSDDSTITAIDRFIAEILPITSKYSLMPPEAHFEFMIDYDVKQITVNGYDLYDYVLTYPDENKCDEKNAAFVIRDFINAKSGYYLDVIPESKIDFATGRIISISGGSKRAFIESMDDGIALRGVDQYSVWQIAKSFMDDVEGNIIDGVIKLKYDIRVEHKSVDTSFEAAFCFVRQNQEEPFKPHYELITFLKSNHLGICFIANPNEQLERDLSVNVDSPVRYQEINVGERKIMLAYDSGKAKSIEISVDEDGKYISVDVETVFDERISYIYIIKDITIEEIPSVKDNTVIFYENCEPVEYKGLYLTANGKFKVSDEIEYYIFNDLNLSVQSSNVENNTENVFCYLLKTKVVRPESISDYALK